MKLSEKIKEAAASADYPVIGPATLKNWAKDAEQQEQAQAWIPVSERMPEARPLSQHQDYVLVDNGNHIGIGSLHDAEDGDPPMWIDEQTQPIEPAPTHWMPRPPHAVPLHP